MGTGGGRRAWRDGQGQIRRRRRSGERQPARGGAWQVGGKRCRARARTSKEELSYSVGGLARLSGGHCECKVIIIAERTASKVCGGRRVCGARAAAIAVAHRFAAMSVSLIVDLSVRSRPLCLARITDSTEMPSREPNASELCQQEGWRQRACQQAGRDLRRPQSNAGARSVIRIYACLVVNTRLSDRDNCKELCRPYGAPAHAAAAAMVCSVRRTGLRTFARSAAPHAVAEVGDDRRGRKRRLAASTRRGQAGGKSTGRSPSLAPVDGRGSRARVLPGSHGGGLSVAGSLGCSRASSAMETEGLCQRKVGERPALGSFYRSIPDSRSHGWPWAAGTRAGGRRRSRRTAWAA